MDPRDHLSGVAAGLRRLLWIAWAAVLVIAALVVAVFVIINTI